MPSPKEIEAEIERMKGRSGWFLSAIDLAGRAIVRAFRIAGGIALGLVALWPGSHALDIAAEPFASLTILKVLFFLFLAWVTVVLCYVAFIVAFGEGPPESRANAMREDWIQQNALANLGLNEKRPDGESEWLK